VSDSRAQSVEGLDSEAASPDDCKFAQFRIWFLPPLLHEDEKLSHPRSFSLSATLSSGHNVPAEDAGLELLLSLDGSIWEIGDGYWIKIEARKVAPDVGRPNRIVYSLTLHSPVGERLYGIDNAHPVKVGSGPSRRTMMPFDHAHEKGRARPYGYFDAATLLGDFWAAVKDILAEEGVT
jgi:hypothetical protein